MNLWNIITTAIMYPSSSSKWDDEIWDLFEVRLDICLQSNICDHGRTVDDGDDSRVHYYLLWYKYNW